MNVYRIKWGKVGDERLYVAKDAEAAIALWRQTHISQEPKSVEHLGECAVQSAREGGE